MFNCLKRFFLVFLGCSITVLLFSMEKNSNIDTQQKANSKLSAILKKISNNHGYSKNDWKKIKKCFIDGANPNYRFLDARNITPLLLSIEFNQPILFYDLLKLKADINAADREGITPLYALTIQKRINIGMLKALLNHKPHLDVQTFQGQTPLGAMAINGNNQILKLLLEHNADINQKVKGSTPLAWSISWRNLECIKLFCQFGASLENVNFHNENVFHMLEASNSSPRYIKDVLIHANFGYKPEQGKQVNARFIETLLVLDKLRIPPELRFLILSKLSENRFPGIDIRLLLKRGGFNSMPIFRQVRDRVQQLKQIMQSNKNSLDDLLNGTVLDNDFNEFIQAAVSEAPLILQDNVVYAIYKNCIQLEKAGKDEFSGKYMALLPEIGPVSQPDYFQIENYSMFLSDINQNNFDIL